MGLKLKARDLLRFATKERYLNMTYDDLHNYKLLMSILELSEYLSKESYEEIYDLLNELAMDHEISRMINSKETV